MIKFLRQLYGGRKIKRLPIILTTLAFLFPACDGDGNQDCSEAIQEQQKICEERIEKVHKNHEAILAEHKKEWQEKKEELKTEIGKLESAIEYKNNRINELLNEVKNLKAEIEKLESQVQEWKQKYEDCQNQLEPEESPELAVRDGKFYYEDGGTEEITLVGVSRWEALWRATGAYGSPGWGDYNLAWYERQLKKYDINYVRHGGIRNTDFLYRHCKRMKKAGIIVEITVFRAHAKTKGILVKPDEMKRLDSLGNVFFDVCNEFLDDRDNIAKAIQVAKKLKAQGCLVSAGGWSGSKGYRIAKDFRSQYQNYDIESHHRHWNRASFLESIQFADGKPVIWNEVFCFKNNISINRLEELMRLALDLGYSGVQYYGLRDSSMFPGLNNDDPCHWAEPFKVARRLVQQYN